MADQSQSKQQGTAATGGTPRRASAPANPTEESQAAPPDESVAMSTAAGGVQVPPPPGSGRPAPNYAAQIAADVKRPTFGQRLGRAIRRFLGWVLVILLGIVIGAALFLFAPRLFERWLRPVQANTEAISTLEARISGLESAQSQASLEQLDVQSAMTTRLAEAEGRLAEVESRLNEAESTLTDQTAQLAELQSALDDYVTQLDVLATQLATLQAEIPGAAEYTEYNRQLLLMRAWQQLMQVRLRMLENNAGLAQENLTQALDTLGQAYALSSPEQQTALDPILDRLDAVMRNLTQNPFAAVGDLEIAWHDLGRLIAPPPVAGEAPASPPAPTLTPTPTPSGTPVPTLSPAPTATP